MTSNEIGGLCLALGVVIGVLTVMIIAVLYVAVNGAEDGEEINDNDMTDDDDSILR